ncbi:unnamed protein product, partial [Phytomonas sp. Hart1]
MKVFIVPRGGSVLDYAQCLPNKSSVRTAKSIRDLLYFTLCDHIAEDIVFMHLSTRDSDDLRKEAKLAYIYMASFSAGSVYPSTGTASTRITKPFGSTKFNHHNKQQYSL